MDCQHEALRSPLTTVQDKVLSAIGIGTEPLPITLEWSERNDTMDMLEILVTLIALALVAIVMAVLLILIQALTGRRKKSDPRPPEPQPETREPSMPANRAATARQEDAALQIQETIAPATTHATINTTGEFAATTVNTRHQDKAERPASAPEADTGSDTSNEPYPYRLGKPLLSGRELTFYQELKEVIPANTKILCKVRASDVIYPKASLSFEEMHFASEQMATHHFDFVLCDDRDFAVLCLIDIDNSEQRSPLYRLHDSMLQRCAESASLPLLKVDEAKGYSIAEIRQQILRISQFQQGRNPTDKLGYL